MTDRSFFKYFSIWALLCILCAQSLPLCASEPTLSDLGETYQTDLFSIASDKDAIQIFQKKLNPKLHLTTRASHSHPRSTRKPSPQMAPNDILRMVANLAAFRLATYVENQTQQDHGETLQHSTHQHGQLKEWLSGKPMPSSFTSMLSFLTSYSTYFQDLITPTTRPSQFDTFASFLDQRYPKLTGSEHSWLGLLKNGKLSEISKRFSEFWGLGQQLNTLHDADSTEVQQYAHYYSWTRLLPVFKSHLIALAIQAEAESMQLAQQSLSNLRNHLASQTKENSAARLCGTWHWTVHNHQNHGDHKMTIFFGDPTQHPSNQPQPTEIAINGNTVYLFWKFPRGYQEDSLLLSNNDKRLEGTFTNTLGPYGSITGKRLSSCKP